MQSELALRILMVSHKHIFGQGLSALLAQQGEFEMVGQMSDARQDDLLAEIELLRPDVVVMDSHSDEADPTPPLMRCLRNGWAKKIITVNLQDNVMCVYTSERRVVEEVENLVEAIAGVARA